jgi:hypothetical protein
VQPQHLGGGRWVKLLDMRKRPSARHLFKPAEGPYGNVVLNFTGRPQNEFAILGRAYQDAGKSLVQVFSAAPGYSDFDAYPIVFVYRHAMELAIKAVLNLGNQLAVALGQPHLETSDLFRDHSLARHLPKITAIFEEVGWNDALDQAGLPKADEIIKELDRIDPGSFAFRYTIKKDGSPSVDSHFTFAPGAFATALDPVLDSLLGACSGLEEYLYSVHEYNAEMRSYQEDYPETYNDGQYDS